MRIRTLVVDSEFTSRQTIRAVIVTDPEISLVAECNTFNQARAAISEHQPSLMFLDARMPDCDCLDLVRALGTESLLATIFVLPQDNYAMKAFDGHALGCLARPV